MAAFINYAWNNFYRAKSRARISKIFSLLRGKRDDLLSLEDVKKIVAPTGESYVGCKTIPVGQIVGSEGRTKDFNDSFCPRKAFMCDRWVRVDTAYYEEKILPPVKLLEIGGVYFVRDGNHRVSVARSHDVAFIDAEITRLNSKITLYPNMTVNDVRQKVHRVREADVAA